MPLGGDRSATLRQGRHYRLLVVANGQLMDYDVRAAVLSWGLDPGDTAISWPSTWTDDRPPDWPVEEPPELSANEALVRVSGSMTGPTRTVGHDTPVRGGTLSVVQAWDYGSATPASPEDAPSGEDKEKKTRSHVLLGVGVVFAAALVYKFTTSRKGMSDEEERYRRIEARADHARRAARIRELMGQGHGHDDAEAIAEHESYERAFVPEPSELGGA
jgi:hypothetical protein